MLQDIRGKNAWKSIFWLGAIGRTYRYPISEHTCVNMRNEFYAK